MSDHEAAAPPTTARPEARLSDAVRAEAEAFFRENLQPVLARLLSLNAPYEVARDAVQAAGLDMLRRWEHIEFHRAYLYKAAMSNFLKHKRDNSRIVSVPDLGETAPGVEDPAIDSVWADRQWVMDLIRSLPPSQRDVLALAVDHFTPAEMAVILGRTPVAIRQALLAARRRLELQLPRQRTTPTTTPFQRNRRGR